MNIKNFLANAIKVFWGWPLPLKIFIGIVGIIILLEQGSRFQWWKFEQDTKNNTTPHKQTVDVTRVPSQVKAFLSDENLQEMDEAGMNIYTGDNPPNIEGTYVFKDMAMKYDPTGAKFPLLTYYFTFKNQNNNTVEFSHRSEKDEKGKVDLAEGKGVFISGEGNCFSVYLDNDEQVGECESKFVQIFSACKDKSGLVDTDDGTLWTYMSDKCPKEEFVPAGYIRIFSHKTLAPRQ